ncbi:MAG: hypothetical protein HYW47_08110 [Deltaproteobacteria bacterium]|nr:hypothetical protein [Deltaproteobacteria bacterium]
MTQLFSFKGLFILRMILLLIFSPLLFTSCGLPGSDHEVLSKSITLGNGNYPIAPTAISLGGTSYQHYTQTNSSGNNQSLCPQGTTNIAPRAQISVSQTPMGYLYDEDLSSRCQT